MGKFDTNPFDRKALTNFKLLAGRKNEFNQIRFILRNSSKQVHHFRHILIIGNRGVGKTSFLNLIESECSINNLIPIRVSLTTANTSNPNEFFWNIFDRAINKLFEQGLFGGFNSEIHKAIQNIIHGDGSIDQANWVFNTPLLRKNYLSNFSNVFEFDQLISDLILFRKEIIKSGKNYFNESTKMLFLVDEAQLVYANKSIIEEIRYIIQRPDLGIGFVFAGDTSFEQTSWENVFGGSHRDFEIINLNYFEDVESVIDYFEKSLSSVGWSSKDIEESLFYRFKVACSQIYNLTSGNPSWINTIALKMFDRCMKGESDILRFDRAAQNDVKKLFEATNQIDISVVDYIENLSFKLQKWISMIFDCEFTTLNNVYFYGKFIFIDDNSLTIHEYKDFCKELVDRGVVILAKIKSESKLGFNSQAIEPDFLDIPYIAFHPNADSIKQWLQISSDGKYKFGNIPPITYYIKYISDRIVLEKGSMFILHNSSSIDFDFIRFFDFIKRFNNNEVQIEDFSYDTIFTFYRFFKKLQKSSVRQIFFGMFHFKSSGKFHCWNTYYYDDKGNIIGFRECERLFSKYISIVEQFNSENSIISLDMSIDNVDIPDIILLQKLIMQSKDKKKYSIILDDKLEDMVNHYIKESNLDSSFAEASFFYERFLDGFDLNLRQLNNSAYVYSAKHEYGKALELINDALRKIQTDDYNSEEEHVIGLVYYNRGILFIRQNKLPEAKESFNLVLDFCIDKKSEYFVAQVLNILQKSDSNQLSSIEIKEGDKVYSNINYKDFSIHNLSLISELENQIVNN